MQSRFRTVVGCLAVLACAAPAAAMVSQATAVRAGLTRAWTAQVGSPRATGSVVFLHLDRGLLLVQTETGTLNALDAETGRTLWTTQVGPRNRLCSEPASNEHNVVVVNGSMLYVLDRETGDLQWQKQLVGTPGAGPTINKTHVFVPMVNGKLEGYALSKGKKQQPWNYRSTGQLLISPVATDHALAWTTERGHMYVADPEALRIRYRLETRGTVRNKPAYWTPYLYAASSDGNLYAVNEHVGKIGWKFMMGEASYESPVAINGHVYIITEFGHMYCINGNSGKETWHAPGMAHFVSASGERIYATDKIGQLVVLDAHTGNRLGACPLDGITHKLANTQTDRLYVCDGANAVQCLHEPQLKKPLVYLPPKEVKIAAANADEEDADHESANDETEMHAPVEEPIRRRVEAPPVEKERPPVKVETDDEDPFK